MRPRSYLRFSFIVIAALVAVAASAQVDCTTAAPFAVTASNSSPSTEGGQVMLTADAIAGATYTWSGPGGFFSNEQSPTLSNVSTANGGTYTVVVNDGCTSAQSSTNVVVNPRPTISIDNFIGKAPARGATTTFDFHITLSNPSTETVTVQYYTSNQTAYAGKDYVGAWQTVAFGPGTTQQTVSVTVIGTGSKTQKQFLVNLNNPSNATIAIVSGYYQSRGTGVIQP